MSVMLHNVTRNELLSAQNALTLSLATRFVLENNESGTTQEAIAKHMKKFGNVASNAGKIVANPFALGFAHATGFNFDIVNDCSRFDSASEKLFNEKAIPKMLLLMGVLNGGNWGGIETNDTPTLLGVIYSLPVSGEFVNGKLVREGLRKFMIGTGGRKEYDAALSTQTSSSIRALSALGIVKKNGNTFAISRPDIRQYLLAAFEGHERPDYDGDIAFPVPSFSAALTEGVRKRAASMLSAAPADAPQEAPATTDTPVNVIEGVCEEVKEEAVQEAPATLLLSAPAAEYEEGAFCDVTHAVATMEGEGNMLPVSVAPAPSADSIVEGMGDTLKAMEEEGVPSDAPQTEASAPVVEAPAVPPAPAKASRKRNAKKSVGDKNKGQ